MDNKSCLIYCGLKFTVEWYYDKNGKSVANEYYLSASEDLKIKFLVLKKMGDFGKIFDTRKFCNEGDGIYAFKPQPDRYLSFFTYGKKIIVTNGFSKNVDKLPKNEKALAIKYMQDYLDRRKGG